MNEFVAALPMYDWPELRAETDAQWSRLREALRRQGIDAPEHLARRNADLPPAPGGIRDADGKVIAPDPATLPPDELNLHALWLHPALLFAQTCWGPMELGMAAHVQVAGQPDYSAFEGGQGELYSSAIVVRALTSTLRGEPASGPGEAAFASRSGGDDAERCLDHPHPASQLSLRSTWLRDPPRKGEGGGPCIPLDRLRGKRFAYNSPDSMSGLLAPSRDLEAMGESLDIFSARVESGGHRRSVIAVAEGRADVAAIDCRSWAMAQRFEPKAKEVEVVGWTARRKGLPYIAARSVSGEMLRTIRETVAALDRPTGLASQAAG